jgi:hypothetical protein
MNTPLLDTLVHVDGVPVAVSIGRWPDLIDGERLYHIEFRSTVEPPRPIPVSETGYRSHFAYGSYVDLFPSLVACVEAIAREHVLRSSRRRDTEKERQRSLFD